MKLLIAVFSMVLLSFGVVEEGHAKRLGKGGVGKNHSAPSYQTPNKQAQNAFEKAKPAARDGRNKTGILGGVLGGLLAGGLIASLLGGDFEGFQWMDLILVAVLAFIGLRIFKVYKQKQSWQYAQSGVSSGPQACAAAPGAFGQATLDRSVMNQSTMRADSVVHDGCDLKHQDRLDAEPQRSADPAQAPMHFTFPAGFNRTAFLSDALGHYRRLQQAWNQGEMSLLAEFCAPELFAQLSQERAQLKTQPSTEVRSLKADIAMAKIEYQVAKLTVRFSGDCYDSVADMQETIHDLWHLERDLSLAKAPWLVVGIDA